ncbi:MAG: uracil-DNA glycosylase family protein [Dehalococcoidales bacterium]
MYSVDKYSLELNKRIEGIFLNHPEWKDTHNKNPWLTGFLGNPFSNIWFVGENPSLRPVETATKNHPIINSDNQWNISRGDKLFRQALLKSELITGSLETPKEWHCYVTDIIKDADYANKWRKKPWCERCLIADIWEPVLKWELQTSEPKIIVAMGNQVMRLLTYLQKHKGLNLNHIEFVHHYSYIAFWPDTKRKLGPMNEQRIGEYYLEIERVAKIARSC